LRKKRFSSSKRKIKETTLKGVDQDVPELLKGVEFSMGRNGPDLYLKTLEKLQMYV